MKGYARMIVKPASLHFARTARALYHARMARRAQHLRCSLRRSDYVREANERTTDWITRALRDATYVCERGVLSEFRAARTCASYWVDKRMVTSCLALRATREGLPLCGSGPCQASKTAFRSHCARPTGRV